MSIRFIFVLFLVVPAAAFSMGRVPQDPPADVTTETSREFQGRSYRIFKPPSCKSGSKCPIVLVLHGGDGGDVNKISGMGTRADKYLAVFPQNTEGRAWNDGKESTADEVDDVQFMLDILADVQKRDGGDPSKAFVAGISNGAMMTQRLACDAPEAFRAYASIAGKKSKAFQCPTLEQSPFVFFHGTADTLMVWGEGNLKRQGDPMESVATTVAFWAVKNGCSGDSVTTMPDAVDDGMTVTKHTFPMCDAETVFYEIEGGGHTWPGPPPAGFMARRGVGSDSQDIDATAEILTFFRAHGL